MTNRTRGVLLLLWPLSSCYSPNDTIATGPEGAEGSSSGSSSGGPTGEGTGTDTDTSASASSTSPGPDSDNEALATLAHGVDVDAAGVAYVGGLAEYGGNLGAHGWVRAYDDAAALVFDHDAGPEVFDVGVSDDGNAALVGSLIALLGIEGEPLGPLQTRRLAPDGDTLWTEDLESFPYLEPYAQRLAVDSEENIIVVANFREGTSAQAWARKFSPNGTVMWTRLLDGGAGHDFDRWLGVAAGPDNEVAIVGAVDDEAWIRLYDQDGAEQWTLAGGAAGSAVINSAIDEDGNIVLAEDSQNVGTIRKLSSIGTQLWSVEIPDFSPTDVAVDSQQNILVSGNGDGDGWVRKLAP